MGFRRSSVRIAPPRPRITHETAPRFIRRGAFVWALTRVHARYPADAALRRNCSAVGTVGVREMARCLREIREGRAAGVAHLVRATAVRDYGPTPSGKRTPLTISV